MPHEYKKMTEKTTITNEKTMITYSINLTVTKKTSLSHCKIWKHCQRQLKTDKVAEYKNNEKKRKEKESKNWK